MVAAAYERVQGLIVNLARMSTLFEKLGAATRNEALACVIDVGPIIPRPFRCWLIKSGGRPRLQGVLGLDLSDVWI